MNLTGVSTAASIELLNSIVPIVKNLQSKNNVTSQYFELEFNLIYLVFFQILRNSQISRQKFHKFLKKNFTQENFPQKMSKYFALALVLFIGLASAYTCNNCDASHGNICVRDNMCLCNGNHQRAIYNDDGTSECVSFDFVKGVGISFLVMIVSVGSCGLMEYYGTKNNRAQNYEVKN